MALYSCPRCVTDVELPDELTLPTRMHVANTARTDSVSAVRTLHATGGLTLRQAKAYVAHVTRAGGQCHRCKYVFTILGPSFCPGCSAFNIND